MTTKSDFRPAEDILLSTPLGLEELGSSFNPHAPFSACRLCGSVFQTEKDRQCREWLENGLIIEIYNVFTKESVFSGSDYHMRILDESTQERKLWREGHDKNFHSRDEIASHLRTGFAFTPEAAAKLAPFGITPLGNLHPEIVDALATAPRAPYNDAES